MKYRDKNGKPIPSESGPRQENLIFVIIMGIICVIALFVLFSN